MKNVLQNIIKIIIIGSLSEKALVFSNRHYLEDPSFSYYANRAYYPQNPYSHPQEPEPEYYVEEVEPEPEPVPYEEEPEYYSSPQLIRYNRNYYSPRQPQMPRPPQNGYPINQPSYLSSLRMKIEPSQENFNTLRTVLRMTDPEPAQLPGPNKGLPTIIIEKEEPSPTFYAEETKGYLEDEYSDNYSDDGPPPEPAKAASLNYPYQYFEPVRLPSNEEDGKLIISYPPLLREDLKNIIPVLKSPITILPSRFPPRIEQIIERIQNYFSTYNPQVEKPVKNTNSSTSMTAATTATFPTTVDHNLTESITGTIAGTQNTTPESGEVSSETIVNNETDKTSTNKPNNKIDTTKIDVSNSSTEEFDNSSQEGIPTSFQISFPMPEAIENGTTTEGSSAESEAMPQSSLVPQEQNFFQRYHHYMQNMMPNYAGNFRYGGTMAPSQNGTAVPIHQLNQSWNYNSMPHMVHMVPQSQNPPTVQMVQQNQNPSTVQTVPQNQNPSTVQMVPQNQNPSTVQMVTQNQNPPTVQMVTQNQNPPTVQMVPQSQNVPTVQMFPQSQNPPMVPMVPQNQNPSAVPMAAKSQNLLPAGGNFSNGFNQFGNNATMPSTSVPEIRTLEESQNAQTTINNSMYSHFGQNYSRFPAVSSPDEISVSDTPSNGGAR